MAESMTPAWLMPIQKTKFVMKKPQKTGRVEAGDADALIDHESGGAYGNDDDQSEEHDDSPVLHRVLEEAPEQIPVNPSVT